MRVLGVDPGLRLTGYGCVEVALAGTHALVEAGVFRLARVEKETGDAASVSARLIELERDFAELLERVKPQAVAVEGLFAHAAHPVTAAIMGHARGVLLLTIARRGLTLVELKPAMVKKFMTGSGRAEKAQMQRAVQAYFQLAQPPSPPDVADALAIALCAAERLRVAETGELAQVMMKPKRSRRTLPRDVLER
jgi:crossover junction endodeoxyribonuclease RuvC